MIDVNAISASLLTSQQNIRTELGLKAIRQAVQVQQAVADMLEENARAVEHASAQPRHAGGRIDLYG